MHCTYALGVYCNYSYEEIYQDPQGRTEEFGERGVQYEFDEGAGQEMSLR